VRTVLVTGATGKQGGSVVRALIRDRQHVRALTRNPGSKNANALHNLGAEIVVGSLDDVDSIKRSVDGVHAVFSVQNYWEKSTGYDGEIQQGVALARAAMEAGVAHYVQSTMATAEDFAGVPHFESKRQIERNLKEIGVPHTLLGTVYFMENMLDPKMGGKMTFPSLSGTLHKDTGLHLLSAEDIGHVVCTILGNSDHYLGQRVDIAGDFLTVEEMKRIFQSVMGKRPKWYALPRFFLRLVAKEFANQLEWHNRTNFKISTANCRQKFPLLTSFETFLKTNRSQLQGL
jgi:uncharacterized protein YbjT (DUF2867 family)